MEIIKLFIINVLTQFIVIIKLCFKKFIFHFTRFSSTDSPRKSRFSHNVSAVLCFVDRASRYIREMKTNLMHYLSSVYFVKKPLHISGISVAHHQEVYCIYTTVGTCCALQLIIC